MGQASHSDCINPWPGHDEANEEYTMNTKNSSSRARPVFSPKTLKRQLRTTQATLDQLQQTHEYINAFFENYAKIRHS